MPEKMKENAGAFGLPVPAGDAASRSVGVRREVAIGRDWKASASARGRTGGAG
jgi:hypothetical protein